MGEKPKKPEKPGNMTGYKSVEDLTQRDDWQAY